MLRPKGSLSLDRDHVPETGADAVLHVDGKEMRLYYPRQKLVEIYPVEARMRDLVAGSGIEVRYEGRPHRASPAYPPAVAAPARPRRPTTPALTGSFPNLGL